MRIGLAATSTDLNEVIAQGRSMEADGFTSLWFGNAILGDPLAGIAVVGRETKTLELGTSVLQTYPCHPLLQANRAASVANAMGRSFTLGIGPSHRALIEGFYGLSYEHPGRNTEEYARIMAQLLGGEKGDFEGEDWTTHGEVAVPQAHRVPLLISAMSPRLLRVAGELADGTITFLAGAKALESHVVPRIRAAAQAAGRPEPRIVVGLPVAVHEDIGEVRAALADRAAILDPLPNYQRILSLGGYERSTDVAITGNARSVKAQLRALLDAGASDIWAGIIAAGDDPQASRHRTLETLRELLD